MIWLSPGEVLLRSEGDERLRGNAAAEEEKEAGTGGPYGKAYLVAPATEAQRTKGSSARDLGQVQRKHYEPWRDRALARLAAPDSGLAEAERPLRAQAGAATEFRQAWDD